MLDKKVTAQALRAVEDADVVLFVLDATTGLTAEDEAVAQLLRRARDKVLLVANKVDSARQEADAWELVRLGFGEPALVSALHGRGVGDLLDLVVDRFPPEEPAGASAEQDSAREHRTGEPRTGRPAARWSGPDDRRRGRRRRGRHRRAPERRASRPCSTGWSATSAASSTTWPGRPEMPIDTIVETEEGPIRFIDTAGLRRKSRIGAGSEYYSLVRSLAAIDRADVALLVIDAARGSHPPGAACSPSGSTSPAARS